MRGHDFNESFVKYNSTSVINPVNVNVAKTEQNIVNRVWSCIHVL